jgi:hypothetical protein
MANEVFAFSGRRKQKPVLRRTGASTGLRLWNLRLTSYSFSICTE